MAPLTYRKRQKLRKNEFAIPEHRAYPIEDESHARNALARVAQHGSPREKAEVRRKVHERYPSIDKAEDQEHFSIAHHMRIGREVKKSARDWF